MNTDVNPHGEPSHQIIDMASLDPSDDQDRPDRMPMSSDTSSVVSYSRHRRSPSRPDTSELRSTTVRSSPLTAPEHSEDQGVTAAQVQARAERVQTSGCPVEIEEPPTERYGLSDVRRGGTEEPRARTAQAVRAPL